MRPSREPYDDVSSWRIGGIYPTALPQATLGRTERLARRLTAAAVVCVDVILQRLLEDGVDSADERFATCAELLRDAQAELAAADSVTGEPLVTAP